MESEEAVVFDISLLAVFWRCQTVDGVVVFFVEALIAGLPFCLSWFLRYFFFFF